MLMNFSRFSLDYEVQKSNRIQFLPRKCLSYILMGLSFEENKTLQSVIYQGAYYELQTELNGSILFVQVKTRWPDWF